MTYDPRILLDTNVLLDATDVRRARHTGVIDLLQARDCLVITAQIIREYLSVSTRPVSANGLGMEVGDALANLGEFRKLARLLPEEKPVLPTYLSLLTDVPCRGRAVHDAFLVATMLAHGVTRLVTANADDFVRYGDRIRVITV